MEQREEELLVLVKSWQGHIPIPHVDILILDEIGKNISGAGMDTKVANRSVTGLANCWPGTPIIERIFVRDISSNSYGNAVGLGMADVISDRLLHKIDWKPTRINSLTASTPAAIRTPVHFAADRDCIEVMMPTVGKLDMADVTFCRIRNTMEVNRALVSENLLPQIKANPICEILDGPLPFEFDTAGDLTEVFRGAEDLVHA